MLNSQHELNDQSETQEKKYIYIYINTVEWGKFDDPDLELLRMAIIINAETIYPQTNRLGTSHTYRFNLKTNKEMGSPLEE